MGRLPLWWRRPLARDVRRAALSDDALRRRAERRARRAARVALLARLTLLSRQLHREREALEALVAARGLVGVPAPAPAADSAAVDFSSLFRRRQSASAAGADEPDLTDAILAAVERGGALPRARRGGARFAPADAAAAFGAVRRSDTLALERLRAFCGDEVTAALRGCRPNWADRDHWGGEHGAQLRRIAKGESLISVSRDVDPFSPVALFTPLSQTAYAATASREIVAGEPIAQYAGELMREDDEEPRSNSYLYALDEEEMRERGYEGRSLRINAASRGGIARFINDRSHLARGLPRRRANCFAALVFDPSSRLPLLVLWASRRIQAGQEVTAPPSTPSPYGNSQSILPPYGR